MLCFMPFDRSVDLQTFIGLGGFVVTVALAGLGIWLTVRSRWAVQLVFFRELTIGLLESIAATVPDLAISYKEKYIDKNLILFRGRLVSLSRRDITPEMVQQMVSAKVAPPFRWLSVRTVSTSPNLIATARIVDHSTFEIDHKLFRRDEFVAVEAIAELQHDPDEPESKDVAKLFSNSMTFEHRIADSAPIEVRSLPTANDAKIQWGPVIILSAFVLFFSAVAVASMFSETRRLRYSIQTPSNHRISVSIKAVSETEVLVKGINTDFVLKQNIADFFSRPDLEFFVAVDGKSWTPVIIMAVLVSLWAYLLAAGLRSVRFAQRVRRTVETSVP